MCIFCASTHRIRQLLCKLTAMTTILQRSLTVHIKIKSKWEFEVMNQVLYICVSFWLLAHESRDISQVETKITLDKRWNSQNGNYFHSKWRFLSKLNNNYFWVSLSQCINHWSNCRGINFFCTWLVWGVFGRWEWNQNSLQNFAFLYENWSSLPSNLCLVHLLTQNLFWVSLNF